MEDGDDIELVVEGEGETSEGMYEFLFDGDSEFRDPDDEVGVSDKGNKG